MIHRTRRLAQRGDGGSDDGGDALRLAIKLAVDAGEYERAAALLDMLRRAP